MNQEPDVLVLERAVRQLFPQRVPTTQHVRVRAAVVVRSVRQLDQLYLAVDDDHLRRLHESQAFERVVGRELYFISQARDA